MLCKCLVVKNPWAVLLVDGVKDVENRTWNSNYRGKLLIKSSKVPVSERETKSILSSLYHQGFITKEQAENYYNSIFDLNGCILGEVTMVDVQTNSKSIWAEKDSYHFVVENAKRYRHPLMGFPSGFKIFNVEVDENDML